MFPTYSQSEECNHQSSFHSIGRASPHHKSSSLSSPLCSPHQASPVTISSETLTQDSPKQTAHQVHKSTKLKRFRLANNHLPHAWTKCDLPGLRAKGENDQRKVRVLNGIYTISAEQNARQTFIRDQIYGPLFLKEEQRNGSAPL